jgi:SAM-dependent methyltransferase
MASYPADLYVALHQGTPGDVAFYQRQCESARRILELGCGDGRVLTQLRRKGRTLVGLDRDPAMLRLAEKRFPPSFGPSPRWQLGDMADFHLPGRFDAILIPFSGFFCLSPRKKRYCLRCVARHLAPGGRLVLDAYEGESLRAEGKVDEPQIDDFEWMANVTIDGANHEVFERNVWWPSRQRLDVTYEHRPTSGARVRRGLLRHWYLSGEQVRVLLADSGFRARRQRLSQRVPANEHWACVASLAE